MERCGGSGSREWRWTGQDRYLTGVSLTLQTFDGTLQDHEHCEFCGAKFGPAEGHLHTGYCALDRHRWICPQCFQDFREMLQWKLV